MTPNGLGAFVESGWHPGETSPLMLPIPDADSAGVTDTIMVSGLPDTASIEAVVLEISATHSYAADLGVTLTSPGGTESIVNPPLNVMLNHLPEIRQLRLLGRTFCGEKPNGEWTIHVADLAAGDTGELESWRLRFYCGEHPKD